MTLTLKQKQQFLRRRRRIRKVVLDTVRKEGAVVFGGRAVNRQVPKHLQEHTEDFDIFLKKGKDPKKFAKKIERKLDKKFKGNFFEVRPSAFPGTEKVVSRVSGKGIVDVSKHKEKVKVIRRKGVKFANLEFQKKKIRESLADPESKFRRGKDKFTRLRIKLAQKKKKKRKRRVNRDFILPTIKQTRIKVPRLF